MIIQITQEEYDNLLKYRCQLEKIRKAQKKYAEKHRAECYARTKRWQQRKKLAQ